MHLAVIVPVTGCTRASVYDVVFVFVTLWNDACLVDFPSPLSTLLRAFIRPPVLPLSVLRYGDCAVNGDVQNRNHQLVHHVLII